MAGSLWVKDPTWKPFYAPYHISLHGYRWFRAIVDLSMHIYGAVGSKRWLFWGVKTGYYGRLVMKWGFAR